MKERVVKEKKIIKARLCARGFKEEQNSWTESPTCSREGLRLSCCIISSNWWTLNSLDVKTVFLQGKTIEKLYLYVLRKKPTPTKFRNCENVFMALQMPVDTGI